MRKAFCQACHNKEHGVRTRVSVSHTCGDTISKEAESPKMITIITFEDHGQDFLTWHIDEDGRIVDCKPFQFSVWSKWTVTNKGFEVGGFVQCKKASERLTIKYPIENIQLDNTGSLIGLPAKYKK